MKNSNKKFKITIAILSVALTVFIVATIFFFDVSRKRVYYTNVGEEILIEAKPNKVCVSTISYPSNMVGGVWHPNKIVLFSEDEAQRRVRVKISFGDVNAVGVVDTSLAKSVENWSQGEDGYYYYNELFSGAVTPFATHIFIPQFEATAMVNMSVCVVVETLDLDKPITSVWNIPADLLEQWSLT